MNHNKRASPIQSPWQIMHTLMNNYHINVCLFLIYLRYISSWTYREGKPTEELIRLWSDYTAILTNECGIKFSNSISVSSSDIPG